MFTLCSCQRSPLLLKCPLGRGEFLLSARVLTAGPRMRDACAVKETRRRRPSWHRVKAAGRFGKSNLENRMISVAAFRGLPEPKTARPVWQNEPRKSNDFSDGPWRPAPIVSLEPQISRSDFSLFLLLSVLFFHCFPLFLRRRRFSCLAKALHCNWPRFSIVDRLYFVLGRWTLVEPPPVTCLRQRRGRRSPADPPCRSRRLARHCGHETPPAPWSVRCARASNRAAWRG